MTDVLDLAATDPTAPTVPPLGPTEHQTPLPDEERQASPLLTSVASFLAASAAAWMCAGIFVGTLPKIVAFVGPLIGAGLVALSYRTRRPSVIQYLALPASVVVGALLVTPDATGGTANLPGLVREAIRAGGVAQPPIPFDPGWRFILVVVATVLAAAGATLAIAWNRPKVTALVSTPLVVGAALVQPKNSALVTTAVALVLLIGSLAVAYGAELQREGTTTGRFEFQRLGRGAAIVVALLAVLWGLSQAGFLFPSTEHDQVIPPKRPETQPPQGDRVVFKVNADRPVPWRLGVLDVYQDNAWMLPPFDTGRFKAVPKSGRIATTEKGASGSFVATFTIEDIEGHVLPTIAGATSVKRVGGFDVSADPRTGMLRLPSARARRGMTYEVRASHMPTGDEMAKAGPIPQTIATNFLQVPPPPIEITALLAQAPKTNAFQRLQYVRTAFYQKVVAAGAGQPVDVPPSRVVDMLRGGQATPYEITAAEALLSRWAGIPSRIGYGYYAGEKRSTSDQTYEVHPRNGSTWLEAYFTGYGWVPILGTPPRAKSSLNQSKNNKQQQIRPTKNLALVVYVPVRLQSVRLLFVLVRYWLAVTMPFVLLFVIVWAFYPGLVKLARRTRRRRWSARNGAAGRIITAYAEFRDVANDLNVGDNTATPLQFTDSIDADAEHVELAWLATRALWGDLSRDLRDDDAASAEEMALSVTRRLRRAAPAITKLLAFGSRASLHEPYIDEIPNLWPAWARRGAVRSAIRRALRTVAFRRRLKRLLPKLGGAAMLIVIALTCLSCTSTSMLQPTADLVTPVLPKQIVPIDLRGIHLRREPDAEVAYTRAGAESLVAEGRVFTLRRGTDVLGALEVGAFKPGMNATEREIREGVINSIGTGQFELTRIGDQRIFVQKLSEQRILLWFPERMQYFELLIARSGFDDADQMFASILAYQRGDVFDIGQQRSDIPDPRRGPLG